MFGLYCERRPFTGVIVFSGAVSSILAYALWGFAHDLKTVFIFTVTFAAIVRLISCSTSRFGADLVTSWSVGGGHVIDLDLGSC